ncbi:NAD(P)H-hydrate dehydratase [Novosphingobium sp. 9U]|uniref:NAD(P)H-hydrate dehydratase n=1 Tax=Novosphingobium sp. 9U TaxID=2653158 RepID=UPI0012F2C7DA|nr:NAD(P)H-hydrate dehydratase [Novosphingobium sp. 9U]VWX46499.1 ADP-dependent (S)-NAD(P)H-hydrate dehydratase [Novosphingobium sp. 9U]
MTPLDDQWLADHPLPGIEHDTDKNKRGRLLIAGGSEIVPGALLLSGEAGYRAGAGKVQLALPASAATGVGISMPEAAVFPLPVNAQGELGPSPEKLGELIGRCDALVLGPGMGNGSNVHALIEAVLEHKDAGVALLLDAAAIVAAPDFADALRGWSGPLVLTPHPGEMAGLMKCEAEEVCDEMAAQAAERFDATVLLKGPRTVVATSGGPVLQFHGGGPGMATGGSGDVLAGVIGGLLARGADAQVAAAWGVWAHGESGRILARSVAPIGFLARELLPAIPALLYAREPQQES